MCPHRYYVFDVMINSVEKFHWLRNRILRQWPGQIERPYFSGRIDKGLFRRRLMSAITIRFVLWIQS